MGYWAANAAQDMPKLVSITQEASIVKTKHLFTLIWLIIVK